MKAEEEEGGRGEEEVNVIRKAHYTTSGLQVAPQSESLGVT